MKAFFVGVIGAIVVLLIAGLIYVAFDTHRMAVRGDAAATFIEQELRKAQSPAK